MAEHRLPLAGVGLVLLAAALVNWVTGQINILGGLRESFVGAVGIGVFVVIGVSILAGMWFLAGARSIGPRSVRRLAGVGVLLLVAVGVAGFLTPGWELGGVSLRETSAGGDLGNWLATPFGALLLLMLAVVASALIDPGRTTRGLAVVWRGAALTVRNAAEKAPTARLPGMGGGDDPWAEDGDWAGPAPEHDPALDEHHLAAAAPLVTVADEKTGVPEAAPEEAGAAAEGDTESAGEEAVVTKPAKGKQRRSNDGWQMPPLSLLKPDAKAARKTDAARQGEVIVTTLAQFGVDARVLQVDEGPSVTQIGIEPGWEVKTKKVVVRDENGKVVLGEYGQPLTREEEVSRTRVRVNRITRLTNDLALALAAPSIRVLAPVPGKPVVGIEVPNKERRVVSLRGVIESPEFKQMAARGGLPIALGRDVSGQAVVMDLATMPHLLIAGATGAGKSVAINSIIAGLLMQLSPEAVRLVMIDPKRVELTGYSDIPHLAFSHVVTDPEEVVGVLGVVVTEMERRYRRFEHVGARNIAAYNNEERAEGPLPYWVVILDELADLMMAAPVEVEQQLVRLAQLARATGIHMVVATQRPSVDVVTGLIKANFPTRIAFATSSQIDARVILDRAGAEKLLGRGDMLFMGQDSIQPRRVQGTFVSDEEINGLIDFWTQDRFKNVPRPTMDHLLEEAKEAAVIRKAEEEEAAKDADRDSLYEDAVELAREHTRISTSLLQRRLRIGYPRAARLIDLLEEAGAVSAAAEGGQSREVLLEKTPLDLATGG